MSTLSRACADFYRGQKVLITGASSGIGACMAQQVAPLLQTSESALILVARREDKLADLAQSLQSAHGVRVFVMAADLSKPGAARALYERLKREGLVPDVVINNAGFGVYEPFSDSTTEVLEEMLHLNVDTLVTLTRLSLPAMLEKRRGGVLNVSSVAGFMSVPGFSAYSASKAFVLNFTEGLSDELRGTGVHAAVLCPGPTLTEFHTRSNTLGMAPGWAYWSAEAVAEEGLEALASGQVVKVTGFLSLVQVWAAKLLPRGLMTRVSGIVMRQTHARAKKRT